MTEATAAGAEAQDWSHFARASASTAQAADGQPEQALIKFQQTAADHRALGGLVDTALMLGHQIMVLLILKDTSRARDLLEQTALAEGIATMLTKPVLHGDNGATLKATRCWGCCTGWVSSRRTRGPA